MGPLTPEQQQLVVGHYHLAIRQARAFIKLSNLAHVADELESAAVLGLCRATHYHDPSRNAKFSTFAYLCIKTEMLDVVRVSAGWMDAAVLVRVEHRLRPPGPDHERPLHD